jgi:hypothetical protein
MNIKRGLAAFFTSTVLLGAVALPASAQFENDHAGGGYDVPTPKLLTDTKMDWVKGSSEWVNLSWTASADLTNVKVYVVPKSKGLTAEYPTNQKGYTSLLDNGSLSASEIDFTSVKITTDASNSSTKLASVYIRWDYNGRTYQMYSGRLQLSNKTYKGEDFAILTEGAVVSSAGEDADANWVEFNYKGLAPRTSNMKMSVDGAEVYHPQGKFTSLHHDETLYSGETDVARIWLDPELLESGEEKLVVNITYTDFNGESRTEQHAVALTIK